MVEGGTEEQQQDDVAIEKLSINGNAGEDNKISPEKLKELGEKEDAKPSMQLRNMLEDIEEGELDYEEDPDLEEQPPAESQPSSVNNHDDVSEDGEIASDGDEEREEGEIKDDDETGQVYVCVDPLHDKWKKVSRAEQKRLQSLEEGQVDDGEEKKATPVVTPNNNNNGRFIPKTLCKYFNNGLCRWGSTCRFLHPGVNDKGIPFHAVPTWNAVAGNYVMHRPPGMYPTAFGKAPAPMECINGPVLPAPFPYAMKDHPARHLMPPREEDLPPEDIPRKVSAWEKGLRRAKEVKLAAMKRREEDKDFEEKRLSMKIPEGKDDDKEGDDDDDEEDREDSFRQKEYFHHDHRRSDSKHIERTYTRKDYEKDTVERSYTREDYENDRKKEDRRARRMTAQSSEHDDSSQVSQPILRREERQRQREREAREKREYEEQREHQLEKVVNPYTPPSSHHHADAYQPRDKPSKVVDPRSHKPMASSVDKPAAKNASGANEWHDPWMRKQPLPIRPVIAETTKPGLEAISDSSDSSSDSDSDSSKSSDSDSDSSSSGDEDKKPKEDLKKKVAKTASERRDNRANKIVDPIQQSQERNEPLSYQEWKKLQNEQKALQKQEGGQYKDSPSRPNDDKKDVRNRPGTTPYNKEDQKKKQEDPRAQRGIDNKRQIPAPERSTDKKTASTTSSVKEGGTATAKNDDKFDSPKKRNESSDSDSDSDSGSDDSDSDDSSESESESGSDSDRQIPSTQQKAPTATTQPFNKVSTAASTTAKKDVKPMASKPMASKPMASKPMASKSEPALAAGMKRPVRKDELLKELKAVEDAIARKRAKID